MLRVKVFDENMFQILQSDIVCVKPCSHPEVDWIQLLYTVTDSVSNSVTGGRHELHNPGQG